MEKENYRRIFEPVNSTLYSVQNKEFQWGVVDEDDKVIVEFGKYSWIDGFQNGLAKVVSHRDNVSSTWVAIDLDSPDGKAKEVAAQGIINEKGEEVLPLEYNVWKFYGKDFPTIKTFKDGVEHRYYFNQLNPDFQETNDEDAFNDSYHDDFHEYHHYEEFAGSYAQDVAGYSDEDINDVFDGDPEAYWNID